MASPSEMAGLLFSAHSMACKIIVESEHELSSLVVRKTCEVTNKRVNILDSDNFGQFPNIEVRYIFRLIIYKVT